MAAINSDLVVTASTGRKKLFLIGSIMKVIAVVTSDEIHIISDSHF